MRLFESGDWTFRRHRLRPYLLFGQGGTGTGKRPGGNYALVVFLSRRYPDYKKLALNLGVKTVIIPITPIYQAYLGALREHFPVSDLDVSLENIQARIRGNILMAFSNKYGYLVLSTGNKSELAVGYCTLSGDMSGGLAVISDVPKTMIYELARYVNRREEIIPAPILTKAPPAELRPDQKDQDTLPPYEILDQVLEHYINDGLAWQDIVDRGFDPEVVSWIMRAVDRNEYQAAAGGPRSENNLQGLWQRPPHAHCGPLPDLTGSPREGIEPRRPRRCRFLDLPKFCPCLTRREED